MSLLYFVIGAFVGGVIGYACAAIMALSDNDINEEEDKEE